MGIAALVLGILSVVICWIPCVNYFAFIPAVIGLILGIVDTVQKSKKGEKKGISIAGIVLTAVAIVVIALWTLVFNKAAKDAANALNSLNATDANEIVSSFENAFSSWNTTTL